jgi:alpha-L-rhamnosidase
VPATSEVMKVSDSNDLKHGLEARGTGTEWQNLIDGNGEVVIPPRTMIRAIIDLEDYYCVYPSLLVTGGAHASVRVHFAESLCDRPSAEPPYAALVKGDRAAVEGKYFAGDGDTFEPDGGEGRLFETLWWRCGRFIEIFVETKNQPLTIHEFTLRETRYPLEMQAKINSPDERFSAVVPIMFRTLQMCCHETYLDCPYYEQLMYVGDTRLQVLAMHVTTRDDRLPRKALLSFDRSRLHSGLTQSRFPSRILQEIPPFSLWWIAMLHDFAMWRGDHAFVKSLMPTVRSVIDFFLSHINRDGLVTAPRGWNFYDWVPGWHGGIPADGEFGVSGPLNWHLAYTLQLAAELEEFMNEPHLSSRARHFSGELSSRVTSAFYDEKRKLFADDLAHQHFSEHAQCLAILCGETRSAEALIHDPQLYRTTIYFTHYLFEAYRALGRVDFVFDRMKLWFDLPAQGFKTTPEMPEPTRSDCHAWGAHPLYHWFASVLGIRPASFGFETVRIEPNLGPLKSAAGVLPHPRGVIEVHVDESGMRVSLPDGVKHVYANAAR